MLEQYQRLVATHQHRAVDGRGETHLQVSSVEAHVSRPGFAGLVRLAVQGQGRAGKAMWRASAPAHKHRAGFIQHCQMQ